MNRSVRHAVLFAFATVIGSSPVFAQKTAEKAADKATDKSAPFITVNGKAIPKVRADLFLAAQIRQGVPDTPELRKQVSEELIRREILAQEALRKGMDKAPDVVNQIDLSRQGVLINAYFAEFARANPVTDDDVKKEYESAKVKMGDKEYKVRHVLVEKEDEAKAIIVGLKKGDKFEDMAKQSKDPGSKERGGDLGWANPAAFVPAFADAMKKLAVGKFTEAPVKSDFGWHVIQLDETRDLKMPALDQVKGEISKQLLDQKIKLHIEELRSKAKIK